MSDTRKLEPARDNTVGPGWPGEPESWPKIGWPIAAAAAAVSAQPIARERPSSACLALSFNKQALSLLPPTF